MTVYQHLISGLTSSHRYYMSLHTSNDAGTLPGAHAAFLSFTTNLWNGPTPPSTAMSTLIRPDAQPDTAITYTLNDSTGAKEARTQTALSLVGTGASERLPPRVCAVVNLRTGEIGRTQVGRVYQFPMTTASMSIGTVTAATITKVLAGWQFALDQIALTGYQPVVYHRKTRGTSDVTSIDMTNRWSTQRRRNKQIGFTRTTAPL